MSEDTRVHLGVTLDLGGDTISGTVQNGASPIIEFTGWLELMSALDTVSPQHKLWPTAKRTQARRSARADSRMSHKTETTRHGRTSTTTKRPRTTPPAHPRDERQDR